MDCQKTVTQILSSELFILPLIYYEWNFIVFSIELAHNYFLETYFEIELVKKLEITIEKQRNEIKKLDQSVIDYKAENEEVNTISL